MKIIRPQNNTPKSKEENLTLFIEGHEVTQFSKEQVEQSFTYNPNEELIDDNIGKVEIVNPTPVPVQVDLTIENLMDEIIKQKDDKVQVTISLTKRQHDLYLKKGGEQWVKKALVGVKTGKKKKK